MITKSEVAEFMASKLPGVKYRLLEGSHSTHIYVLYDEHNEELGKVAKIQYNEDPSSQTCLQQSLLYNEYRILTKLHHPHIIQVQPSFYQTDSKTLFGI